MSPLGEAQAADAITHLQPFGLRSVVSSPLVRARETAAIIAGGLGVEPASVVIVAELAERHVGEWSGLTRAEIEERYPEAKAAWSTGGRIEPPGEGRLDFVRRVVHGLQTVERLGLAGPVLVVCHGGVIGAMATALGVEGGRTENLGGRWFRIDDGVLHPGDPLGTAVPEATSASPTL